MLNRELAIHTNTYSSKINGIKSPHIKENCAQKHFITGDDYL